MRADTLAHALLPALRAPPPAFAGFLASHFRLKRLQILEQCDAWVGAARTGGHAAAVRGAVEGIRSALERYKPRVAEVIDLL